MKKTYVQPNSSMVHVNLLGTVLEGGKAIGGQSRNPVSDDVDPGDVDWSAKSQDFDVDEDDSWGDSWK